MKPLKNIAATTLKLAICGASIFAIGAGMLVLDGKEVQNASADIVSLSPVPLSNTAKMENSLDALGHTEPRIYDFNGNEVAFSTSQTRKKPSRIIEKYQREFVRQGLNEEAYIEPPAETAQGKDNADDVYHREVNKHTEAMLSGQIIPLEVRENYATMAGGLIHGQPNSREALNKQLGNIDQSDVSSFEDLFDGYRMIEVFRDPESGTTSVTASWSRGHYDIKKHLPETFPNRQGVDTDVTIPACIGCVRRMSFDGETNAKPDGVNVFETPARPRQVVDFYDRAMRNRGWKQTRTDRTLNNLLGGTGKLDSRTTHRTYRRGENQIVFNIRRPPELDKTTVTSYQLK